MSISNNNIRDPYSFFLKVVSRTSIPKNMLALAKFWLPFQKWRIIGKKRRQNGYMLKNLCVSARACFSATKVGIRHAAVPPFQLFCLFFASFTIFFLGWRRRYAIQISPHVFFMISCQATFLRLNASVQQRNQALC